MSVSLLVIEWHVSGHRPIYVRWVLESALDAGLNAVLACPRHVRDHAVVRSSLESLGDRIRWIETAPVDDGPTGRMGMLRREWAYVRALRSIVARLRPTIGPAVAFVPYLDYCYHALAVLGSPFGDIPWAGVSMRLPQRTASIRWQLLPLLMRDPSLCVLYSLGQVDDRASARWPRLARLSDPAEFRAPLERDAARQAYGVLDDELVVLVFGTIDGRKGVSGLLSGLRRATGKWMLIVVGRQSADASRLLQEAERSRPVDARWRILPINAYVDDAGQAQAFAAADVVWLGYENHDGMSGVLVLAGLARRPVIACRNGLIGAEARMHDLGPVVDVAAPAEVASALDTLMDPAARGRCGDSGRERFASHEARHVGREVMTALLSQCGRSSAAP